VTWNPRDLRSEVLGEFIDAQAPLVEALRRNGWQAHSYFVRNAQLTKKRWSLRALRKRLHGREAIECKRDKCRVRFVPWRGDTLYCSDRCRRAHLSLQIWYRKHRKPAVGSRVCARCGARFEGRKRGAIYCSVTCNQRSVQERKSGQRVRPSLRCVECGAGFEARRADALYCTRQCAGRACNRRYYDRHREAERARARADYWRAVERNGDAARAKLNARQRVNRSKRKARRSAA